METKLYNPSQLEVNLMNAIASLTRELEMKLPGYKVESIFKKEEVDNPSIIFRLQDRDNDPHEVVIRIIQRNDEIIG
jgi:hypothetical protein